MMLAMREHVLCVSEVKLFKLAAICQGFIDVESVRGGPQRPRAIVVDVGGQTAQIVTRCVAVISVPPLLQDVQSFIVFLQIEMVLVTGPVLKTCDVV